MSYDDYGLPANYRRKLAHLPPLLTPPHCDSSVLHEPGSCRYCDRHPDWQALRDMWGIAYTGHAPTDTQIPCPSDQRRGTGEAHVWGGNRPTDVEVPQRESFASKVMYGWHRGDRG